MSSLRSLDPSLYPAAEALVREAAAAGLRPRVTSARRTAGQQEKLYRKYLAGATPYPVAPPGSSLHEYGLAFDMLVTPMEYLAAVGELWESWGGHWGGERDPVHFDDGSRPPSGIDRATVLLKKINDALIRYGVMAAELVVLPWWAWFLPDSVLRSPEKIVRFALGIR